MTTVVIEIETNEFVNEEQLTQGLKRVLEDHADPDKQLLHDLQVTVRTEDMRLFDNL